MKLILPGEIIQATPVESPGLDRYVTTTVLRAQSVPPVARGARVEEHELEGAEDSDLVEIEYENGIKHWVTVEQLRRDIEKRGGERRSGGNELRLAPRMQVGEPSRGKVTDLAVRFIRVIRSDPKELAAEAAANLLVDFVVVQKFERNLVENPGIYRIGPGFTMRDYQPRLDAAAPYLLFLHGTASNTMGSFGGIVAGKQTGLSINPPQTEEWKTLSSKYNDRILALEHKTLTLSPIENAIALADDLPDGARLHLVSHSRGGLVGELLCMGRPSDAELGRMRDKGRAKDAEDLVALAGILDNKKFQVERFVRVACPARGTILASGRVDTYLTIIFNLMKLIPALRGNPIFAFLEATIRETAKMRTDPTRLPGLEAMMPDAPLIRLLNTKSLTTASDLGVIAGDIEGEGILGTLKIFAVDLFYREDHDLVVNTAAMYGGLRRTHEAVYFFERGPNVSHFDYFGNASTRAKITQLLQGGVEGFQKIESGTRGLRIATSRAAEKNPVLILVPGFMGSHLKDDSGRVWLDYDVLAAGGMSRLAMSNSGIQPDEVIARGYEPLVRSLQAHYDVRPLPYDWRKSAADAADSLAAVLDEHLKSARDIKILAHSQGAVVALLMMVRRPELWREIAAKRSGRLLMLGGPLGGSFAVLQMLLGRGTQAQMLAMLDDGQTPNLREIFASWPGLVEMLPVSSSYDLQSQAFWSRTGQTAIAPELLAAVPKLRESIARAAADHADKIAQLLGSAEETISAVRVVENGVPEFQTSPFGDGRVLYADGEIRDRTWYVDAQHGDLPTAESAFPAIRDILESGTTVRLPKARRAQAAPAAPRIFREERALFPDETSLADAVLGMSERRAAVRDSWTLKVSVLHGNLKCAEFPVAVGHYQGDTIVHAEAELDEAFDGALSARYQMGIYPGPKGSVEVILRPDGSPPGALIVGLGPVGEMSGEVVRLGVFNAALRNAMAVLQNRQEKTDGFVSAAFSSVLIGTYGTRALSIEESVATVVQAALEANRALRAQRLWDKVRIDAVEIIELYEQKAVQAVHAACSVHRRLGIALEEGENIDASPMLRQHESGKLQPPSNQYATGWWRRIEISGLEGEGRKATETRNLSFKVLTDRARAEQIHSSTQKKLLDQYVERAITSTDFDRDMAVAMYELMVPNELKDQADSRADLLLEVDPVSARFPWEMMADRTAGRVRMLATEAGMLRQFRTAQYRRSPRMSAQNTALVIGEPKLADPRYPALRGAREEAAEVARVLRDRGFDPALLVDSEPLDIVTSLFARDYRIIHIAAHGEYDPKGRSGVVMGDGLFLGAAEFGQMRVLPDMVFLNCCHLGQIPSDAHAARLRKANRLAASVAEQLICDGVRVVVVAGWAVNDAAAMAFARYLYQDMLRGEKFGKAVLNARASTCKDHSLSNTWAAYQCYGDADFILEVRGKVEEEPASSFPSRGEYLDRFRNIGVEASSKNPAVRDRLRKELAALEGSVPEAWRDGEVLAALAAAYSKTGLVDDAIRVYERAVQDPAARAPIVAVERLANLQDRHAKDLILDSSKAAETEREYLRQRALTWTADALKRVEALSQISETSERMSLIAGAYKRRGWVEQDPAKRREALEKAAATYKSAWDLAPKNFYPAVNWVALQFLLGAKNTDPALADVIAQAKTVAEADLQRPYRDQDIWTRVALADVMVLEALIAGTLPERIDAILAEYRNAIDGEGDWRTLASIRGQIELFRENTQDPAVKRALERIIEVLQI